MIFKFFFAILGSNYTFLNKFVLAILFKSRRMILDCQLNNFLENCLKTAKVAFKWADVFGFKKPISFKGIYYTCLFVYWVCFNLGFTPFQNSLSSKMFCSKHFKTYFELRKIFNYLRTPLTQELYFPIFHGLFFNLDEC